MDNLELKILGMPKIYNTLIKTHNYIQPNNRYLPCIDVFILEKESKIN
jgi:hypothetical protein